MENIEVRSILKKQGKTDEECDKIIKDFEKEQRTKKQNAKISIVKLDNFFQDIFELTYFKDIKNDLYMYYTTEQDILKSIKVDSRRFKQWINNQYFQIEEQYVPKTLVEDFVEMLLGRHAENDDLPVIELAHRVLEKDGYFYFKLNNNCSLQISKNKVEILKKQEPLFYEDKTQLDLKPTDLSLISNLPPTNYAQKLFNFVNIEENQQCLFLTLIASYLIPDIPHPILLQIGAEGSGKTFNSKIIKNLMDPTKYNESLSLPKDENELNHHLSSGWIINYDNLSYISPEFQNVFCQAVTGGNFLKRKYYTDGENYFTSIKTCIMMNSISLIAGQDDFRNRLIEFSIPVLKSGQRFTERKILSAFQLEKDKILFSLMHALSNAMQKYNDTETTSDIRMLDFYQWGSLLSKELGYMPETFENQYTKNIQQVEIDSAEGNKLLTRIAELDSFKGYTSDLYIKIGLNIDDIHNKNLYKLPKDIGQLSKQLKKLIKISKRVGVNIKEDRCTKTKKTIWTIEKIKNDQNEGSDNVEISF